jgi:DnaK suppressor protein
MYKMIKIPVDYKPSENEEYMSPIQLAYFKQKLEDWKGQLIKESLDTIDHLREENWREPDPNDMATTESERSFELRTRDRYRKLIDKIDAAVRRIDEGKYGYCEETGEEIGIKRLEARPIATLSIEAQERHESYENQHSEED